MGTGWQTPSPLLSSPLFPLPRGFIYCPGKKKIKFPQEVGLRRKQVGRPKVRTEGGRQRPREEMRWGWGGKRERNGGSRVRTVAGFSSGLLHTGLCFQPSVDMTFAERETPSNLPGQRRGLGPISLIAEGPGRQVHSVTVGGRGRAATLQGLTLFGNCALPIQEPQPRRLCRSPEDFLAAWDEVRAW